MDDKNIVEDKRIKVSVKTLAYERGTPKKRLSQFENDSGFVDAETLESLLESMRQWIIEHFAGYEGGKPGGNLNAGSVLCRDTATVSRTISGQSVQARSRSVIRFYFYGGAAKARKES